MAVAIALACVIAGCGSGAPPESSSTVGGPAPSPSGQPSSRTGSNAAGVLLTAGRNLESQLGRDAADQSPTLAPVPAPEGSTLDDVIAVTGGGRHSVAVREDGTVLAWGANDQGQLGDGTTNGSDLPRPVRAPDGAPGHLDNVVSVSADTDFTMALRSDGTVVTWGRADAGQRGIGTTQAQMRPTTVLDPRGDGPLREVAGIAADGRTAIVLLEDGSVLAWGSNGFGQVGDGTTTDRPLPVAVAGVGAAERLTGAVQVEIGGQHAAAVLEDGRVLTWGRNDRGQLGNGTTTDRSRPGLVVGMHGIGPLGGVVELSAAEKFNLARLENGTVVAWGANGGGQLGDGTAKHRLVPVQVLASDGVTLLTEVAQIHAGEAYGVAVLDDGRALSWGSNGSGQLASGQSRPRVLPGPLSADRRDLGRVLAVGAGERHLLLVAQT